MLKLELIPEQPSKPGYGRLYLHGWEGQLTNVYMRVQRSHDKFFLADNGSNWQSNPSALPLPDLLVSASGHCWLSLGPKIIKSLLIEPLSVYCFTLSDGQKKASSEVAMTMTLAQSLLSGEILPITNSATQDPVSSPATQQADDETKSNASLQSTAKASVEMQIAEPMVEQEQTIVKKISLIWLWNLFLLLVILGGVGWFISLWLNMSTPDKSVPPLISPLSMCNASQMAVKDEFNFMKSCLDEQPDSKTLLEVITTAKTEKRCGIAQRIYAYKAQGGDAIIALVYAQEYDPLYAQPGGCFAPDVETAVYWYEVVLKHDKQNTKAKERLAALMK